MSSGHTAVLYVAHDDVEEEEAVVLVMGNPSSPFSPEKPHSQVPENGAKEQSLRENVIKQQLFFPPYLCIWPDLAYRTHAEATKHADLVVQRTIWRNISKSIHMCWCVLHTGHLHSLKCAKSKL